MANNYTKTMRQALQEARNYRDPTSEGGPGSGPQKMVLVNQTINQVLKQDQK